MNQEGTENLYGAITTKEIEAENKNKNKNLSASKSPGSDGFTGKFLANIQRRTNIYPSQTFSKNSIGSKTPKFIL